MALPRLYQSASIFGNGSAYSSQNPKSDHDPLANLLNFEDVDSLVGEAGSIIKQAIDAVLDGVVEFIKELTGIDLSSFADLFDGILDAIGLDLPGLALLNPVTLLTGFGGGSSIITQFLGLIPGLAGGTTGLSGLGDVYGDLFGLMGSPTGVGSGTPGLPGISSIPLLGGLLSGGNILTSIIPGLDASKIVTGLFSQSQIANLVTMLGGFGTGSSILSQFIGTIPGTGGSPTGLSGLGSIFTDWTALMGSPTALGTGTPLLPSITGIPLLGGLLTGGNIKTSIVPGLDASKITTGLFSQSQISGLVSKFLDYPITGDLIESLTGVSGGNLATIGPPNVVVNGDFPSNITGWTNVTGHSTWESTIGRTAAGSMKMAATANSYATSSLIAVTPGESVYFEEWFRTASITTGTAASVNMFVFTFDGSSVYLDAENLATSGISAGTNPTWVKVSGSYVVPAGVSYVAVAPEIFDATGGFVYFDDIKVTKSGGANLLPGLIGGVTPGVSLLKDVDTFLTNMFNKMTGNTAVAATQEETASAIAAQTDTVSGTASSLAQFLAAFGPGNPDSDNFERTSAIDLGADWTTLFSSGSGPLATPNGHDAHYSGAANTEYMSLKNDVQAATDHQTVTMVFAGAIPTWPFFTPFPFSGSNDAWLRCLAPTTWGGRTGLRFRVSFTSWDLSWFSAGTQHSLASGTLPSMPTTGTNITLEAGVGGNNLRFVATFNGSPISGADFTDTSVTSFGALYCYRGKGGMNNGGQGSGDLQLWTAQG